MINFRRLRASWRTGAGSLLWLALLATLFLASPQVRAQDNATINGAVLDASGAVVPNATISITNTATNQTRETVSNSTGSYRFANLGVGHYTLTATASGFQKYTKTDIVVNVAQTVGEDITLTIGSASQTVTVAADALQVQSETSEVSTLISGEQVEQLATNGRNVTSLAALGLGVSNNLPAFSGVNALTSANGISFNGARASHNIYMIDGGEQNDRGCGGCFMNLPSQDSIAEFQHLDSNYSPDYGRGSGGTILMVLKSGTHDFHGSCMRPTAIPPTTPTTGSRMPAASPVRSSSSTFPAATSAGRCSSPTSTTMSATARSSLSMKNGGVSSRAITLHRRMRFLRATSRLRARI